MGKIVITTNISLDGVVEDPDGQEGFTLGGWFGQFGGKDLEAWAKVETEEALGAEALLLGRRSDEWFATRWRSRSGGWADKLNSMPKFVVSSTLEDAKWSNATIIKDDVVSQVGKLKQEIHGEILVYASYQLVHTLIEHDLVDLPGRAGGRRAPVWSVQRQNAPAPRQRDHHRRRPDLRDLRGCEGRLTMADSG